MRKAGKVVGKKRGRPASLLGTPTSSRANSTSRVNSPVMVKNFDTPKRRNATRTSLPDSPVPNKMARKTPARHQDLPLDSVRSDNVDHFRMDEINSTNLSKLFEIPFVYEMWEM
ncbi:hypothetical protein EVAR_102059_1 [Eumeta japonica]|uniref:Uncharacterized protein n=1 Tax=Eumeta variegata TaxID=151549 RepID=A0A4C1TZJ6_EUMVA|nr:hypothetical protein EVAR_102059_1 [Eumeta japonica]